STPNQCSESVKYPKFASLPLFGKYDIDLAAYGVGIELVSVRAVMYRQYFAWLQSRFAANADAAFIHKGVASRRSMTVGHSFASFPSRCATEANTAVIKLRLASKHPGTIGNQCSGILNVDQSPKRRLLTKIH